LGFFGLLGFGLLGFGLLGFGLLGFVGGGVAGSAASGRAGSAASGGSLAPLLSAIGDRRRLGAVGLGLDRGRRAALRDRPVARCLGHELRELVGLCCSRFSAADSRRAMARMPRVLRLER